MIEGFEKIGEIQGRQGSILPRNNEENAHATAIATNGLKEEEGGLQIIKTVDFDRNGFIEYDEFIRVCIPEDRLFTVDNLKNAFNLFDKSKEGSISYLNVVEAVESEERINPKMIDLFKIEVAKMGDEKINFDQFYNLMVKLSVQ